MSDIEDQGSFRASRSIPTERGTDAFADLRVLAEKAMEPMPPKRRKGWWGAQNRYAEATRPAHILALLDSHSALLEALLLAERLENGPYIEDDREWFRLAEDVETKRRDAIQSAIGA